MKVLMNLWTLNPTVATLVVSMWRCYPVIQIAANKRVSGQMVRVYSLTVQVISAYSFQNSTVNLTLSSFSGDGSRKTFRTTVTVLLRC